MRLHSLSATGNRITNEGARELLSAYRATETLTAVHIYVRVLSIAGSHRFADENTCSDDVVEQFDSLREERVDRKAERSAAEKPWLTDERRRCRTLS